MRRIGVLAIVATLAISACGSDSGSDSGGDQQRLADELMQAIDAEGSGEFVDEECIRDKTNELSDEDAERGGDREHADLEDSLAVLLHEISRSGYPPRWRWQLDSTVLPA